MKKHPKEQAAQTQKVSAQIEVSKQQPESSQTIRKAAQEGTDMPGQLITVAMGSLIALFSSRSSFASSVSFLSSCS